MKTLGLILLLLVLGCDDLEKCAVCSKRVTEIDSSDPEHVIETTTTKRYHYCESDVVEHEKANTFEDKDKKVETTCL